MRENLRIAVLEQVLEGVKDKLLKRAEGRKKERLERKSLDDKEKKGESEP